MSKNEGDTSLIFVLIASLLLLGSSGWGLFQVVEGASADLVSAALTNVSTAGGIVSGLSLSGTAVLTLNGRFTVRLISHYGPVIRFILFGGFTVLVSLSLACAFAVVLDGNLAARLLLSFGTPSIFVILVATALLINSAFIFERKSARSKPRSPLRRSGD